MYRVMRFRFQLFCDAFWQASVFSTFAQTHFVLVLKNGPGVSRELLPVLPPPQGATRLVLPLFAACTCFDILAVPAWPILPFVSVDQPKCVCSFCAHEGLL